MQRNHSGGGFAAEDSRHRRRKKHTECAVPTGTNFLRSGKFQKDLILFVVRCYFGALIRGLENLESPCEGVRIVTFCVVQKVLQKHARTCKKLPVASFCASETAETGRIANGREQGDHVSRRQSGKGFNWASAKFWFECADSRFAEPRRVSKGFNFVSAWSLFGGADSRFGKPRISLQGRTDLFFSLVRKERGVPQRFANLWTPGTIQISARFIIFAEVTGVHHVPGRAGHCKLSGYRR